MSIEIMRGKIMGEAQKKQGRPTVRVKNATYKIRAAGVQRTRIRRVAVNDFHNVLNLRTCEKVSMLDTISIIPGQSHLNTG